MGANRLRLAELLAAGKLSGKEKQDAEANPIIVQEARRIAKQSSTTKHTESITRKGQHHVG